MPSERARAKINLSLLVGRLVEDPDHKHFGYHPLSSLVAFADIGDEVSCEIAESTSLSISGPFADGLESDQNNLILKAYHAVAAQADLPPLAFHLIKNLPIASGIGGGSADAAAALRLMKSYVDLPEAKWLDIALSLGADVPVCWHSKTCQMLGIGEVIVPIDFSQSVNALLVNPGVRVSTAEVFRAFDDRNPPELTNSISNSADVWAQVLNSNNDLQSPAIMIESKIGDVLRDIASQNGCQIARMSGSGATCFGIFENKGHASAAKARIAANNPDWWLAACRIGDPSC